MSNRNARRNVGNAQVRDRRLSTETKDGYKTTEFIAFVAVVVGVLVASYLVQTNDNHDDYFRADEAWFYVVLLTIGYMVSRGLAKSGSREPYDEDSDNGNAGTEAEPGDSADNARALARALTEAADKLDEGNRH